MTRASWIVLIVIVITCGGLAAAALDKIRHAHRRTQCANNLKQIGLAIHSYHDAYRRLPGAASSRSKLPHSERLSWLLELYAFVESNMDPLWRTDPDLPWDAEKNAYVTRSKIAVYECPANANHTQTFWTSYVGITGVGRNAIHLPVDDPNAGFIGYHRTISFKDIRDGVGNTICVMETNHDNGPWAKPGFTSARGLDSEGTDYLGRHGQFGSFHYSSGFLSTNYFTMAAFADGSIRPLNDATQPRIFEALATINGGEEFELLP
jgi:hypothetical protein